MNQPGYILLHFILAFALIMLSQSVAGQSPLEKRDVNEAKKATSLLSNKDSTIRAIDSAYRESFKIKKNKIKKAIDSKAMELKSISPSKKRAKADSLSKSQKLFKKESIIEKTKQSFAQGNIDTFRQSLHVIAARDSILNALDSAYRNVFKMGRSSIKKRINSTVTDPLQSFTSKQTAKHDSTFRSQPYVKRLFRINEPEIKKPLVAFTGGYINYSFNYRSNIDTPYAQKDIALHNIMGSTDFTLAKMLPLKVNYWIRQSNSAYFKDITDIQVAFDAEAYRNELVHQLKDTYLSQAPYDSLLEKLYQLKNRQLNELRNWLKNPLQEQKIRGYNEILQLPSLTHDSKLSDSLNLHSSDSLQLVAKNYIALYEGMQEAHKIIEGQTDSLKNKVSEMKIKVQQYQQITKGDFSDYNSYESWKSELEKYQPKGSVNVPKYNRLLNIKSFSLGKSPINYSELTAKNISINGLNIEYNSWYYAAFAAGIVDYRFRDFVSNQVKQRPQYLYMGRFGVGSLQKNFLIFSYYGGRKQLYPPLNNGVRNPSENVSGLSAEAKYSLSPNTYLIAEGAASMSPDRRMNPDDLAKFSDNNNTNKALSIKFFSSLPKSGSRIEGLYKYSGANFQSFSSYQSSSALRTWYIKADQKFFKGKLRLNGSLRSNEFTNPYILQDYKSNTVFKTITASFRARKWPSFSIGYVPMSQLTMIDKQVIESRFQTLTASASHFYKLGTERTSTTIVFNKFYNNNNDTGFIYYRSTNLYGVQNFIFKSFTANVAFSLSKSRLYELTVMDNGINLNMKKLGSAGFGVKINALNGQSIKAGAYLNSTIRITKRDMLYISYENGYLPGSKGQLISNQMGNVQFTKYFR